MSSVLQNVPLYGKLADTGEIACRARMDYARDGDLWVHEWLELSVEVWTSVPVGQEQRRGHCMERYIMAPLSESKYEKAYRDILGTYETYWKAHGICPDPDWKQKLAVACGRAAARFQ